MIKLEDISNQEQLDKALEQKYADGQKAGSGSTQRENTDKIKELKDEHAKVIATYEAEKTNAILKGKLSDTDINPKWHGLALEQMKVTPEMEQKEIDKLVKEFTTENPELLKPKDGEVKVDKEFTSVLPPKSDKEKDKSKNMFMSK